MVQPYLSLCIIHRNNVDTLPQLLESVKGHFDEIVAVDTGSTDGSRALMEAAGARVFDFEWIDDFSAARQFCFEKATGRFRMFLDSDDVLVDGHKIRPFLMQLEMRQPHVEAVFVPYVYGPLERLETMRLVRWREGWKWNDAIHERLEFGLHELPAQAFLHAKDFHVVHRPKTEAEKIAAIRRNARIAEREYTKATDPKYKARLGRTIAMELKADNKPAETIPYLEPLVELYRHYPEGRQAAADIAKAHLALKNLDVALEWAKQAGPAYEAMIHHAAERYDECLKAVHRSEGAGAQTTHEGYAFEKGLVYLLAADSVRSLKLPREADVVDHLLNHIPTDLKLSPQLAGACMEIRKRYDRITILVPGTPQPFDENGGGGMLGGSEEAVMYLSRALADIGRTVRVYCPLPPHRLAGPDRFGVDWQPVSAFNAEGEHGTLVLWRAAPLAVGLLNHKAQKEGQALAGIAQAFLWLHDAGLGVSPEVAAALGPALSGCVVLSEYHKRVITQAGYRGAMTVLSNGIWEADFEPEGERDPNRIIYSSCPSRGLVPLLEMWPEIKKECPDAYLDIYYDWSMLKMAQPDVYDRVATAMDSVRGMDVVHHGGVDHATLHRALKQCNVWAYSHFESPHVETSCISAMKASACGATPLSVPNGALGETLGDGLGHLVRSPVVYRQRLIDFIKNPESEEVREERRKKALERYGWHAVAKRFSDLWRLP